MEFDGNGTRTNMQPLIGHGMIPDLKYCPGCCRAYNLDGSPMENNGQPVYYDQNYGALPEDHVFRFGRTVTDKNDLTKKSRNSYGR